MNGRVGEDKCKGRFTCVKNNGSSVVDYVLCKPDLFDSVYKFEVEEPNILSDHCILNFSFSNQEGVEVFDKKKGECENYLYKWNNDKKIEYTDRLQQPFIVEKISMI